MKTLILGTLIFLTVVLFGCDNPISTETKQTEKTMQTLNYSTYCEDGSIEAHDPLTSFTLKLNDDNSVEINGTIYKREEIHSLEITF
jgi:hypothetical protein